MEEITVRISELPGADPLSGIELVPLVQNGTTKIRTVQNIVLEGGLQDHIDAPDPHPQYAFRVKNNLTATTDPTANDDITQGYEPTSRWVNTVTEEFFICVTNTAGNANWQQQTLTLDELGSAALVDVGLNPVDVPQNQNLGTAAYKDEGAGSGLDADLLDGQHGSYYRAWANVTGKPSPTITVNGDATGSVTLTELTSGTLTLTIVDDSHNHVISNVDGLQSALDSKVESVNGKTTKDIILVTDDISEDGSPVNLWYTDFRARNAIDVSGDLSYNPTTGVISFSETYSTPSELLTAIKTVDGAGSGLDADLLDGQSSAFYRNASNLNSGTIPDARLPNSITSDITGNATTATKLATARTISLNGDLTGSTTFDGSTDVTITATVVDDSHSHVITNIDGLQSALDGKANTTGTYASLRAQATTKADVGLSGIPNTNGSTVNYLRGDGSWVTPKVKQTSQTVSVTTGQTTINLTTITVSSASLPTITVDGYYGIELIRNFTVNNSTTITLSSPIQANGQLTVTNYVAS